LGDSHIDTLRVGAAAASAMGKALRWGACRERYEHLLATVTAADGDQDFAAKCRRKIDKAQLVVLVLVVAVTAVSRRLSTTRMSCT
jgi:hypothetical protein